MRAQDISLISERRDGNVLGWGTQPSDLSHLVFQTTNRVCLATRQIELVVSHSRQSDVSVEREMVSGLVTGRLIREEERQVVNVLHDRRREPMHCRVPVELPGCYL